MQLIHLAYPQLRITIFTHVVRSSVPTFQYLAKQNNFQVKRVITTSSTVGLAEGIIDDACLASDKIAMLKNFERRVCYLAGCYFQNYIRRCIKKVMKFYNVNLILA